MEQVLDELAILEQSAKSLRHAEDAAKKLSKARTRLVLGKDPRTVFFATIAMRLRGEAVAGQQSAVTDGRRLAYDPEYLAGLTDAQTLGMVVHESLHVANAHHARIGDRDAKLWNVAADLAINPIIQRAGLELPPGAAFPGVGEYKRLPPDLGAEEYYTLLRDEQAKGGGPGSCVGDGDGDGDGADPGNCGAVERPGKGGPAECRQAEADAQRLVAEATQAAKRKGELPADLDRLAEQVLRPKVDWRNVLREFVSSHARNDYSWGHPNRRFIAQGLYLPGMRSEELGRVVLAVDTSGSIGQAELDAFAAEAQGVLEAYDVELTIIYCDARVQAVETWRSTDGPLRLAGKGGGGTSHCPVFAHVEREGLDPTCLIALTDLETDFPPCGPDYPVLWCVKGNANAQAPFGLTLHCD